MRHPHPNRFSPAPLAFALVLALAAPAMAQAQPDAEAKPVALSIAAQPLGDALNELAAASGASIAFAQALVAGKTAPAVKGTLTVRQALDRLLAGSGLVGTLNNGVLTVRLAPQAGNEATLPVLRVAASAVTDGATEGTGSYTTRSMNSATKLDLSIRETPQSVSVITRQQLEDQNITTVSQALERSVGITVAQGETDRADTSARGFYANAVRVDGMPTVAVGMHEEAMQADTAIYDRIEIVRGAAGLLTGNGEPGASVNLVRKRPTRQFQGYATGSVGRWNALRGEVDVSGPLDENGSLRGRLVASVRDTDSHVDLFHNRRTALYGVLEADLASGTTLSAGLYLRRSESQGMTFGQPVPMFNSDGSRTDLPRGTTSGADWTFLDTDTANAFGELRQRFGRDWALTARLERQHIDSSNRMVYLYGAPDRSTSAGVGTLYRSYDSKGRQSSADIFLTGDFEWFGRRHEATVGWSYSDAPYHQNYHPLLASTPLDSYFAWPSHPAPVFDEAYGERRDFRTRQDGLYAATRWQLADPVKLIIGARLSNVRYRELFTPVDGTPSDTTGEHRKVLTPYGGVVVDLTNELSAYGSYTQIFQFQTAKDVSGARLDPVTGTNLEVGVKGEFLQKRLSVSAAVFQIEQDNVAEFDGVIDGEERFRAIKGTKSRGFEVEVGGEPLPRWQVNAGFSRRLTRNATGQTVMTEQPSSLLRFTTSHKLSGALEGLMLGAHVAWQSGTRVIGASPTGEDAVQRGYALLHLFGSYRIGRHWQVQVNLNNALNKTYFKGFYNWGYYGEPRNLTVTARYSF